MPAKGMTGTVKGYAGVSFIFGAAAAYAEWKDDVQKDGYDFAAGLLMAAVKAVLVGALAVVATAVIVGLIAFVGSSAVTVLLVGGATVLAGVIFSYLIDAADKSLGKLATSDPNNTDGLAAALAPAFRRAGENIQQSWSDLMKKFPTDYKGLDFEKP
jgi:O-antigen ligase